jgi:hypothetical protein
VHPLVKARLSQLQSNKWITSFNASTRCAGKTSSPCASRTSVLKTLQDMQTTGCKTLYGQAVAGRFFLLDAEDAESRFRSWYKVKPFDRQSRSCSSWDRITPRMVESLHCGQAAACISLKPWKRPVLKIVRSVLLCRDVHLPCPDEYSYLTPVCQCASPFHSLICRAHEFC